EAGRSDRPHRVPARGHDRVPHPPPAPDVAGPGPGRMEARGLPPGRPPRVPAHPAFLRLREEHAALRPVLLPVLRSRPVRAFPRRSLLAVSASVALALHGAPPGARAEGQGPGRLYVVLWFDTEDYVLPPSDDAAKRVAELLTRQGVRATFKVVGEKARTLERRGRQDVIAALAR